MTFQIKAEILVSNFSNYFFTYFFPISRCSNMETLEPQFLCFSTQIVPVFQHKLFSSTQIFSQQHLQTQRTPSFHFPCGPPHYHIQIHVFSTDPIVDARYAAICISIHRA